MFCNQCGTEIINNAKFCTSCGASTQIISEPAEGLKVKDPYDMTPIINLSPTNTNEFNKYFFGLLFVHFFLFSFEFFINPIDPNLTLAQIAFLGIFGFTFLNIPLIVSYFLKKKRMGTFFAGLNFALYLAISIWDFYDCFIVGDEHLKRGEVILSIAAVAISWKLFDLVRKYPSLIGKV